MIIIIGSETRAKLIECAGYLEMCADLLEKEGNSNSASKKCRKLEDWLLKVLMWSRKR